MSDTAISMAGAASRKVAVSRRSMPSFLYAVMRNPLEALPKEVFDHSLVHAQLNGRPRLYVCEPELIQEALVRNADCLDKGFVSRRILRPVLGNGLLTAEGSDWRWQRQSAAPTFQHARLLGFLPKMIGAAGQARDRWSSLGAGARIDVGHEMMLITFNIIVQTMLSGGGAIDTARVEQSIAEYLRTTGWRTVLAILGFPDWTPYPGRRRARVAGSYLRVAVRSMVADRRRATSVRNDLVDLLLSSVDPETGRSMTDEEITDNLLTFVMAGHETTAQGLSWTLDLLSRNPAAAAAVVAEIDAVTQGQPLCPDHVSELSYTRRVFSEAMRLYPPAPMITRRVTRPFRLAGFAVPADAVLIVPIYAVHRQARLWTDPLVFDPDRFLPDLAKERHRYSYMPFGAGPRTCIGSAFAMMEVVVILGVLLRSIRLVAEDEHPPEPTMKITLRPARRMIMRIEPRNR
jgi:cytochrome P450